MCMQMDVVNLFHANLIVLYWLVQDCSISIANALEIL